MKKYLFGIVAICLAVGFTAFTSPNHKRATTTVVFNGDPTVQSEVQDPTRWEVVTPISCTGANQACELDINTTYINTTPNPDQLKSNLTINVTNSGLGFYPSTIFSGTTNTNASNILQKN